ncbi:MAG: leucine-rich repeat protein [Bacteroidales bacterium]|nr:leucine-rich repeat protein [Bacteroidales bacterium]
MKLGKYLLPVALMVVTDACSVYEQENTLQKSPMPAQELVFTAQSGEDLTKTAFQADQTSIWWSPQDAISVFYGASEGSQFTSTNTQEVAKAEFRGTLNAFTGESENGDFNYFWAVYPYSAAVSCDGNSVVATLSETQTGKAGSFAHNTNISIAKNAGLSLAFYNTCAWFRFSLKKEGVKRVIFRGNNNEDVAGTFRVAMGVDGRPTAPEVVDGEKEIVLKMAGNEAFEVGEIYYITLFPQVFGQGFTVTMETETETGSRAINASATYLRSKYNTGIDFDKDVVYQPRQDLDNIIAFADETAKAKLVAAFDTNADGELSIGEASAVTSAADFKAAFGSTKSIRSLDEFQYFTGLTEIPASTFENWLLLTSIALPENIQSIGNSAFNGCSKLVSISIPDAVSTIGTSAFAGCTKLESVSLPETMSSIGSAAFANCTSLQDVVIPRGITMIDSMTFANCESFTHICIPDNVRKITQNAFYGCSGVESLEIPGSVTTIGYGAFRYCTGLTSLTLHNGVYTIGPYSFSGCNNLVSVHMASTINTISQNSFGPLPLLEHVYYDDLDALFKRGFQQEVADLPGLCFLKFTSTPIHLYLGGEEVTEIDIPENSTIPPYAFQNCAYITKVIIPEGISSIQEYAFDRCTGLSNITLPLGIRRIAEGAFYGCSGITTVTFPEVGLNSIAKSAFYGCTGLTTLTLPEGLGSIGDSAFQGCTGLNTINFPNTLSTIGIDSFQECTELGNLTFPISLTKIGMRAFKGCTKLSSFELKNNIQEIGSQAFQGCSELENIVLPESVTTIGVSAFYDCTGLSSITLKPVSVPSGGSSMFNNTNNCPIYVPAESFNDYKAAQYWSNYAARIQAIPEE